MEFMIIENDVDKCKFYDECGVDRIFIDTERLGKTERQGHLNTVISNHEISDIKKIKPLLRQAKILVRINSFHDKTRNEVEEAIEAGADIIMLPMFTKPSEVSNFVKYVNGRVKVSLLLETPAALFRLDDIISISGIDEIHIGLNDMHLALGLDFMLEIYKSPILELACKKIRERGISLGIGGVAPLEMGDVEGKYVVYEALRLGSERSILSRAFPKDNEEFFKKEIISLREYTDSFEANNDLTMRKILLEKINYVLEKISNRR